MSGLRRELKFLPTNGTLRIRWLVHGDEGTVQFVISTGWLASWIRGDTATGNAWLETPLGKGVHAPYALDFGHHWDTPTYEGETEMDTCDVRPSGRCFYDGSGLYAENMFARMFTEGDDFVWDELEKYYVDLSAEAADR